MQFILKQNEQTKSWPTKTTPTLTIPYTPLTSTQAQKMNFHATPFTSLQCTHTHTSHFPFTLVMHKYLVHTHNLPHPTHTGWRTLSLSTHHCPSRCLDVGSLGFSSIALYKHTTADTVTGAHTTSRHWITPTHPHTLHNNGRPPSSIVRASVDSQ